MDDRSAAGRASAPPGTTGPGTPVLDGDGLLRVGDRWVAVSDRQLPVVALLVSRFGTLVGNAEVLRAYHEGPGSAPDTALRPLVYRIRRRVSHVGLELHVVRGRGLVLDLAR